MGQSEDINAKEDEIIKYFIIYHRRCDDYG